MKVFLKVIGVILLIAVVLAAAVGITGVVMINKAADGAVAEDYELDEEVNIMPIIFGTITSKEIKLTEGTINALIKNYTRGLASEKFHFNQLFVTLDGDKGTLYAELELTTGTKLIDKTYPISADFAIDFSDPFVSVTVSNIKSGKVTVNDFMLKMAQKFVDLPAFVKVDGANLVLSYDCSTLDALLEGIIISKLEDPEFIASAGNYGAILAAIPADKIPLVIEVVVENIVLEESELVVTAKFINLTELFYAGGEAVMNLFGGGRQ